MLRPFLFAFLGVALAVAAGTSLSQTMSPGTNTPLMGCVEGRALRVVNNFPACSTTVKPTIAAGSCGTNPTLSANATDFVGQMWWTGLVSSCTLVLSKDYGASFGCLVQSNSSLSLVTTPTVSTVSGRTQVVIPLSASLSGGKMTYTCFPV